MERSILYENTCREKVKSRIKIHGFFQQKILFIEGNLLLQVYTNRIERGDLSTDKGNRI